MRGELALVSRHPVDEAEVALYADWAGQQMLGQSALYLRRGDGRLGWEGLLTRARKATADDPPADTRETHVAVLAVSQEGCGRWRRRRAHPARCRWRQPSGTGGTPARALCGSTCKATSRTGGRTDEQERRPGRDARR
ncbi:hypothetical protein GCM10022214_03250 [Actinomadura miaoliensis]|uniref:GNAT family N-acetyltransferase n=1 Tax=Actinomadura miaoliensis TaxID=430685 RepID=A0ABP7UY48_9ACTN